jgi:hypothetical protein
MRQGHNPHKDLIIEKSFYNHQIVIPVYIPNEEGYFKDSFKIFQLCLESLLKTTHSKTFVTIVNNGSCLIVEDYLNDLFKNKKIQEVIHSENIGKLNAILKGLVGHNIELVTITDCDVLFLDNWQKETVKVFNNFPKAGVVGIVPQFRSYSHCCGNLIFDNLFSKKLAFTKVVNPIALQKFYKSIGWDENYNKAYLHWNLTIENNSFTAIVGSGHFIATYKRALFSDLKTYLSYKLGGDSELYFDELPMRKGLWRMTTNDNYAYHMGNVFEDWMEMDMPRENINQISNLKFSTDNINSNIFNYILKNKIFIWFFKRRTIRNLFYSLKGLPKNEISKY